MKIALAKSDTGFHSYVNWLEYFKADFMIFDWEENTPTEFFDSCGGLILTGGTDVYPGLYGDMEEIGKEGIYTPDRDSYEIGLIENALNSRKPILAICRGMQLLNVYFKGTLIEDLEKEKGVNHRKISGNLMRHHDVMVKTGSMLFKIVKEEVYSVTSTHHQAVKTPGDGLMVNAVSTDGITEGIEFADKAGKPFLLGIQWHPERMEDYNNPFSKNIILKFLEEIKK